MKAQNPFFFAGGVTLLIAACLLCPACSSSLTHPPATAGHIDVARYSGRWHEIARLPMPFQKGDEAAVAEYGIMPNGSLSVRNIATRPDGSRHEISGYAEILNPPENTKLAVHFSTWFAPFIPIPKEGNYWILYVDEGYRLAIVGTPTRKYLWILSRSPKLPAQKLQELTERAEKLGFDSSRFIHDPQ